MERGGGRRAAALALVLAALAVAGPAAAEECEGDACQVLPAPPQDPTPGTATIEAAGNPPARFPAHKHGGGHRAHKHRHGHGEGKRGR